MMRGLTDNHERSLLASIQYATRLIHDCEDVLAGSGGADPLSRYTKALSTPQEKIARDYLSRIRDQLLRALHAVGIQPPPPSITAMRALSTAVMFLDDTFEEMRGRHLRGYGELPPEVERVLDGVVTEMQELTRDFGTFLTGLSDDVLRERVNRLPPADPIAHDLQELARIIAGHGLVDLRPALAVLVDRALEDVFDVAVVGRVSSGKSSLLNALLGASILPTGVLPVTSFPTRLRYGPEARLHLAYANGRTEATTIDRIGDFVSESGNPGNEKRLMRLLLVHPSAVLPADVTFVDTPGLGSVTPGGALQTYAYLPRCDHATFLFEATAPVGEEDLSVLAFLHEAGITTSVLLSKADLLDQADVERVRAYVADQVRKRLGTDAPVRPISTIPSHHALLEAWIRDEVTPLGRQAQGRARAAAIAGRLRDVSARLETTSRWLLSLHERKVGMVGSAITAAARAFVDDAAGAPACVEALRADLVRSSQAVAADVVNELERAAGDALAALKEAAETTGAPAPVSDAPERHHEIPLLDVPPLSLDLRPPLWARTSHALRRRWATDRIGDAWRSTVERAVDAYLDVLLRWATDALTRRRRDFEGQSRPSLTLLTGTPSGGSSPPLKAAGSVQRDLAWLRQDDSEMTHARD